VRTISPSHQRNNKTIPHRQPTRRNHTQKKTKKHKALVALLRAGKLTYVCSQNVDGLHLRSGVPRAQLAELHGDCFVERCAACGAEYARDFELETVGFKRTGRACAAPGCGGALVDSILDWEHRAGQGGGE
jgi:mono-ADP-ribosyltransferase sirtuin 6